MSAVWNAAALALRECRIDVGFHEHLCHRKEP